MVQARRIGQLLAISAVVLGLAYIGVKFYRRAQPDQCYACKRAIHAHSKTVAVANGRPRLFCCPACALTERHQEGKPVQVVELTAFLTGSKLDPAGAYVVQGSDVNMCARIHELISADKQPADMHYDRCAPSLLAFAGKNEAVRFAREHGGSVLPFRDAAASLGR